MRNSGLSITICYVGTSTAEQEAGLQAQIRDLGATGCTKIFNEHVPSVGERQQLKAAIEFVREGDTLVVTKLDRLARSTVHLLSLVEQLEKKGVAPRILDFGGGEVDTKSPSGKMLLTVFAAMAEFERSIMLVRQREGIAVAKEAGKYKGRAPTAQRKERKGNPFVKGIWCRRKRDRATVKRDVVITFENKREIRCL